MYGVLAYRKYCGPGPICIFQSGGSLLSRRRLARCLSCCRPLKAQPTLGGWAGTHADVSELRDQRGQIEAAKNAVLRLGQVAVAVLVEGEMIVAAVTGEAATALRMQRAARERCTAPARWANVLLAVVLTSVAKLHLPWPRISGALLFPLGGSFSHYLLVLLSR